jgi:hypothetical protein
VDFLKGYYEWLQLEGSPYYTIRNHLSYLNFEESITEYASLLKNEYFQFLPEKVSANKELLIKYSKQFFSTVGTEKAFDFIFKVLYNEPVELEYPRNYMLIPSNGKWVDDEHMLYVSANGDVESFLHRRVQQNQPELDGSVTVVSGTVSRINKRYANNFVFAELYITGLSGELKIEYPIGFGNTTEWILPIASGYTVTAPGMNYNPDNILSYSGPAVFTVSTTVNDFTKADMRYSTLFRKEEIVVKKNGAVITDFTFDGRTVYGSFAMNDLIQVEYPVYPGFVVVDEVAPGGGIKSIEIIDMPFGVEANHTYDGNKGGAGAVVKLTPGIAKKIPGHYRNSDGFLSDKDVLQDSRYYQDFSYVIKSGISIDTYRDTVVSLLHPAGFNMIAEVSILETMSLFIESQQQESPTRFKPKEVTADTPEENMYSEYGNVEDYKHMLGKPHYRATHFQDVSLTTMLNFANDMRNFFDTKIDIVDNTGEYAEPAYVVDDYTTNVESEGNV